MKIVREFLYEKFTEDSDPIDDLGIGIYHKRFFKDMEEVYDFLYNIIPSLFKVEHPLDIISKKYPQLAFKEKFRLKLLAYFNDYISVESIPAAYPFGWVFFDSMDFKNYIISRSKIEGISEGVADKYAERQFHIYAPETPEAKKIETAKKIKQPTREPIIEKNQIIHRFNNTVYIVKNPVTLKNIQDSAKGVISKKGDLYLINFNFYTHTEIINALVEKGEIKDHPNWWHYVPENFITIQRLNNKNVFILGESNEVLSPFYNNDNKYAKKYNMPSIEKARKYFIPFTNAAQRKNPQYKFIPKVFDEGIDDIK